MSSRSRQANGDQRSTPARRLSGPVRRWGAPVRLARILPLLLLPLCLPVLVGGVRVVALALDGAPFGEAAPWIGRLAAFDVIFLVLGAVLFPLVVEE